MTNSLVFTKKLTQTGSGFLVWIPSSISAFLSIDGKSTVEAKAVKVSKTRSQPILFTKHVVKSGRGMFIWIPKDISDFLELDEKSMVEFTIRKLVKNG